MSKFRQITKLCRSDDLGLPNYNLGHGPFVQPDFVRECTEPKTRKDPSSRVKDRDVAMRGGLMAASRECIARSLRRGKTFDPQDFLAGVADGQSITKYTDRQSIFAQGDPAELLFPYPQGEGQGHGSFQGRKGGNRRYSWERPVLW